MATIELDSGPAGPGASDASPASASASRSSSTSGDLTFSMASFLRLVGPAHDEATQALAPGIGPRAASWRPGGPGSDGVPPALSEVGGFRVLRELGRGGMGVVYEAEQPPLGRLVALKVLPPSATLDPRLRQRFEIEAQAAALLSHENIVSVFEFGSDRGVDYFAMPRIDGWSLAEVISDRRSHPPSRSGSTTPCTVAPSLPAGGRSYVRAVARLAVQAADALDHAHSVGVIHRDIKPSNLLVDARGKLWVADFGLARIGPGDPALTGTGDLLGTLRYMAPELFRGDRDAASARSDLYALGATLYELLTLRPAFAGEGEGREALLRRILHDEPPAPRALNPALPRDLETIVQKAMAKEPSARYATAAAMADDLRRFLDDRPIVARRPGPLGLAVRWARRRRAVVLTATGVLMAALVVGSALLWTAKRRTDDALAMQRQALTRQALAYHRSLGTVDQIARVLGDDPAPTDRGRIEQAARLSTSFYDQVAQTFADDPSMAEVVAIARRGAGYLRLTRGEEAGRRDYERAIALYERLAAAHPARMWLRTGLIETLTEYADRLADRGEDEASRAALRRARDVAVAVVDDPGAQAPCFTMALGPAVEQLADQLLRHDPTDPKTAGDVARLTRAALRWGAGSTDPHAAPAHAEGRRVAP